MNDKNTVLQEELDILGVAENSGVQDDVRNIIALFKNELILLERDVERYTEDTKLKIKIKLNELFILFEFFKSDCKSAGL